uniref:DNA-directed RNA polymerase n=1 Tax=Mankyua chejuensis TaxID=996148 RepID=H8Y601_9MONI|nr:RNA polymerase beta' subunit [Mankyua chejuensis]ADZ47969.1 RNA polymerase beta' subunit [Mankyua chejuensis]AJJ48599.1 RNA polymerase beta'' subunit [Mankyua chejuensis]
MGDRTKLLFYNKIMDRAAIKRLIGRLITYFGITYTTNILDQLKTLGFQQATNASISLGLDDLLTTSSKASLIRDAEKQDYILEQHHRDGSVHAVERLRQSIETWYATSEYLKQEMNSNFGVTDSLNPVHMMSFSGARGNVSQVHQLVGMRGLMADPQGQVIDLPIQGNLREGLSLTEYIISCYGARKGVVDTAIRTSDAGYLTRRLVEVVQHIVVRKTDCGTIEGILINPLQDQDRFMRNIPQQKLIGRVLADNAYVDTRCIAIRNQDIGNELADRLVSFRVQPIYIRSPLTCRNISWICQLCYGWSLTHHSLVELGEAVGIIAGQSIGEPGTQLTLRTFHTGGVFTGDIAEHVRAPFNGTISFNENSVYPSRTRHGHPAWVCQDDLSVSIRGRDGACNFVVSSQSLILVQNNQYVESKQVIAEVRAKEPPPKEEVEKHIYSDLEGEMHCSTIVYHSSEHVDNNVYPILNTSHVWVLSGNFCDVGETSSIFYDQDKIDFQLFLAKHKSLSYSYEENDRKKLKSPESHWKKQKFNHSKFDSRITSKILDSLYSLNIPRDCSMKRNRISGKIFFPMKQGGKVRSKKALYVNFVLQIPNNGILNRGNILAVYENPKYRINIPGIIRYGTVRVDLTVGKECIPEDGETTSFISRYRILKGKNFFFLPEEIHIIDQSDPFLLVSNNSIVKVGAQITPNISSKLRGLVRIEKVQNSFEIRILPGKIRYPKRRVRISKKKKKGVLISPGNSIFNPSKFDNWVYLQWITPQRRKKAFALVRPITEYVVSNESFLDISTKDPLEKRNPLSIRVKIVEYLLYEDGEKIQTINNGNIQLAQTCLVLDWEEESIIESAYASIFELRIRNISITFLHIGHSNFSDLFIRKNKDGNSLRHTCNDKFPCNDSFVGDNPENQPLIEHQGTIRSVPDQGTSFLILSSRDFFQSSLYTNSKYCNGINQSGKNTKLEKRDCVCAEPLYKFSTNHSLYGAIASSKEPPDLKTTSIDFVSSINHTHAVQETSELGLLGNLQSTDNCSLYFRGTSRNRMLSHKVSFTNNQRSPFRVTSRYLMDEDKGIHEFHSVYSIGKKKFCCIFHSSDSHDGRTPIVNLGQLICENAGFSDGIIFDRSGQIISINKEFLTIRSATPYLATEGATIHSHSGDIIKEGDTLITLTYERLRSGDIIQGLPKVEQLLEARPTNLVSRNLESGFENLKKSMTRLIGNFWSCFLGTKFSIEQSRMDLVEKIQRVYCSQGVYISDKHIEIIVRQITSKVLTLEDRIADAFLPGELIELSRAQRMNRALGGSISYKPIVLGITKASLSTTSFISEASFQETTRVLARAALQGRTDWLKGLKENVVLGSIVPTGTGNEEVVCQMNLEEQDGIVSTIENTISSNHEIKNVLLYNEEAFIFPTRKYIHKELRKTISERNSG